MNTWKAVIHMTDTQQVFRTSHTKAGQIAESLGMHRPLLVAGHFRNLLPSAVVFSGFHPNPDFADCSAGLDLYQNRQCDGIIAIGGGSCIDTAKGILYLLLQKEQHVPPFLAVPTTAGSGSEATDSAVVYVDGKKQSLQDRSLKPCAVILDPSVLTSLPRHQLTSCAMDALCQAVESHWSRKSTAESKVLAEKAIHRLLPGIHMLAQNNESLQTEQTKTLLEGSYLAGQAICMTRTTACHAMSYMITKTFGIPHGQAVALTIPYTIQHMLLSASMQDELARLAALLGLNSAENLPAFFLGMLSRLSLLVDMKPDTETLDFLTDSVNPERLSNHPVSLDAGTIRELYTAICGGNFSDGHSAVPSGVRLDHIAWQEDSLVLYLTGNYPAAGTAEETLCRLVIVKTLLAEAGVESVIINVNDSPLKDTDGQEVGRIQEEDFLMDVATSPDERRRVIVTLYFANENGTALTTEDVMA